MLFLSELQGFFLFFLQVNDEMGNNNCFSVA